MVLWLWLYSSIAALCDVLQYSEDRNDGNDVGTNSKSNDKHHHFHQYFPITNSYNDDDIVILKKKTTVRLLNQKQNHNNEHKHQTVVHEGVRKYHDLKC